MVEPKKIFAFLFWTAQRVKGERAGRETWCRREASEGGAKEIDFWMDFRLDFQMDFRVDFQVDFRAG